MSEKRLCQYCFREFEKGKHQRTAEHIIPKGIIDLFPAQYISRVGGKEFIDNNGITIADVCKYCNGTLLSPLDSYGKELISSQFLEAIATELMDEVFGKCIHYHSLSRWILKIIFNHRRSLKLDCKWFDNSRGYILHGITVENFDFYIFTGIHINTTPLPEEAYDYLPMQINEEPKLLGNSLGIVVFNIDPYMNSIKVPMAAHTYCIRFGTSIFYCILWDKQADKIIKKSYNKIFEELFNFTRIMQGKTEYGLKCVSAHSNTTMGYTHLLSASAQKQDRLIVEGQLGGRSPAEVQKLFALLRTPNDMERGRSLVEASKFPENSRVMRNYEKLFGKDKK